MDRKNQNLTNILHRLSTEADDMKATQPLGGHSFVNYYTSSEDQYDFSIVMNTFYKSRRVTFNFSQSDTSHIVVFSPFMRVDNPNVMAAPDIGSVLNTINVISEIARPGSQSWIIDLGNFELTERIYYLKFFFKGTTAGTFTVEDT